MAFAWNSSKNTWGYTYSVTDHKITTVNDGPRTQSATALPTSAKSYVEVTFDTVVGSDIRLGLSSSGWADYDGSLVEIYTSGSIGLLWGNTGYDFVYLRGNGGSAVNIKSGPWLNSDVLRIALDRTASPPLAWFTVNNADWNGDPTANPATGVGGIDVSFISGDPYVAITHYTGASGGVNTINGGESAFTYSKPSGFAGPAEPAGATLSGQALTSAAGAVKAATSKALTGQSVTSAGGTLAPSITRALTGTALTTNTGTLVPAVSKALTGSSVAFAAGTLTPALSKALTGSNLTFGQGTVTTGADKTAGLTGQSLTGSSGTLAPALSVALTGQSATTGQGALVAYLSIALTGVALTGGQGSLGRALTVSLVGAGLTSAPGSVSPAATGDKTAALAGQALATGQGTLTAFSFGWTPVPATSETWTPVSATSEIWTPVPAA